MSVVGALFLGGWLLGASFSYVWDCLEVLLEEKCRVNSGIRLAISLAMFFLYVSPCEVFLADFGDFN